MTRLVLEYGASSTLDLNALLDNDEGAQALPGLTGAGLPPVDVQWLEGAGNGAIFRGQRVLPRDLDIPIHIEAADRDSLRTQVREFSKALAGEVTIRLIDDNETDSWYVKAHRTGGGDFVYGTDTEGITFVKTVVTLRAGQPFWIKDETVTQQQDNPDIGPTMTVTNPGSAPTYPVWEIHGPGRDLRIISPDGEMLQYEDFFDKYTILTIDTSKGTVVDQVGANRYAGMGAAPHMFDLGPDGTEITVSLDQSSAEYIAARDAVRTNLVTNPSFTTNTTGWTLTGGGAAPTRESSSLTLKFADYYGATGSAYISVSGLTVGASYVASVLVDLTGTAWTGSAYQPTILVDQTGTGDVVARFGYDPANLSGRIEVTFTATATTQQIKLLPPNNGFLISPRQYLCRFDQVYVGAPGTYFDGDTTDTSEATYAWTGTANASTSTSTVTAQDDLAYVKCSFKPRDWMEV